MAGRYVLLEKLSEGGMGIVHRARDGVSGRIVALKQLKSGKGGELPRGTEALFEREYYTLAGLKHPGIIEVYDYGATAAGSYYTMELLEGKDLGQLGVLPYQDVCRYLRDVASSLALLHAHRLVHRDVSPRNIRVTAEGRAKLLDFGALTPFGVAMEVVGTLHCMAPEVLRAMPLDQKTDLFALGAVAYVALTGRLAYGARRMADLELSWMRPPEPPSVHAAGIPDALERLVLALLNPDPAARPSSAAAVMDELGAIAELPAEEYEHAAESYLASGRFVGRETEQAWFDRRVERARCGEGAEVVIEGPSGIGKTRLLHELCLSAQLARMNVVKADAVTSSRSFGVAATLAAALIDRCPEVALPAARPSADLLAGLSSEVRSRLREVSRLEPSRDSEERSTALHKALHGWFVQVARQVPLLVAVDNIQAADGESVAFLAALGHTAREASLMVMVTDETTHRLEKSFVGQWRARAARLKLGGLSAAAVEQLVLSVFGDVANIPRIARLLHQRSAGVPRQCMDLVRLLVTQKIASYAGGTWILPFEVAASELPDQAEQILAARLSNLNAPARKLAASLSVYTKPIPLAQCLVALENADEGAAHRALDELLVEQVLTTDGTTYRFAEEALREAVLAAQDEAEKRHHHLWAAEALLESGRENLAARIDAASHLLRAGEESRGADTLARFSWEFASAASREGHSRDFIDALRRAIEVYERQGKSERELAGLHFSLVLAASHSSEYRLLLEYGDRALTLGLSALHLGNGDRAARVTDPRAANVADLALARIGFRRENESGLPYDFDAAVRRYCLVVAILSSAAAICMDRQLAARLRQVSQSLAVLGSPGILAAEFVQSQHFMATGQNERAVAVVERMRALCENPSVADTLDPMHWAHTYGGVFFDLGLVEAAAFGQRALERAEQLDSAPQRLWAVTANAVRVLYYAFRGESEQVVRCREELELFASQVGGTWQVELFLPVLLIEVEMLTDDVLALRRAWEQFSRLAREIKPLELYSRVARAAYLSARGAIGEALEAYEELAADMSPRWRQLRAHFARTLIRAGQYARAKEVLSETIAVCAGQDESAVGRSLEPHRQLARAESGLGNHVEAHRILDALLEKHGHEDQPLLIGLLHEAKAEVALAQDDLPAFTTHFGEMERRFSGTKNPALLAHVDRLADRAARLGKERTAQGAGLLGAPLPDEMSSEARVQSALCNATTVAEVCTRVLELIRNEAKASAAYLYLLSGENLVRVSASAGADPPPSAEAELTQRVLRARLEAEESCMTQSIRQQLERATPGAAPLSTGQDLGQSTIMMDSVPPEPPSDEGFRIVLLETHRDGQYRVVGGVLLDAPPHRVLQLSPSLLLAIAAALVEHAGKHLCDTTRVGRV